jgi:hypothetical protein
MSLLTLRKTSKIESLRICYADARDRSGIFGFPRYTQAVWKFEENGGTRWLGVEFISKGKEGFV